MKHIHFQVTSGTRKVRLLQSAPQTGDQLVICLDIGAHDQAIDQLPLAIPLPIACGLVQVNQLDQRLRRLGARKLGAKKKNIDHTISLEDKYST